MAIAEPILRSDRRSARPEPRGDRRPRQPRPAARARLGARAGPAPWRVDTVDPADATPRPGAADLMAGAGSRRGSLSGRVALGPVWATHGHYLDFHLLPRVGVRDRARTARAAAARRRRRPTTTSAVADPSLARITRWLPWPLAALLDDAAELIRASTMPRVRRRLLHPRIAPLTSRLLGTQMRRASIPALARVVHRLGVDADWVVFGHVHRLGPLAGDDPEQWRGPGGRPRLAQHRLVAVRAACSFTAPGRRIRTGPAARCCSTRADPRADRACSTSAPSPSSAEAQRRIRWLSPNSCQR